VWRSAQPGSFRAVATRFRSPLIVGIRPRTREIFAKIRLPREESIVNRKRLV